MVVTSMELAVSIQTTPQRLMQSLKDIKIENISNESPLTAGEESSLTNSVQNNTIQTGMYIKIVITVVCKIVQKISFLVHKWQF